MNMKDHILTALRENYDRWEELLASLSEEQITAALKPSEWSVKDVIAHLRAWQQRSVARMEAALFDREPDYPRWLTDVNPEVESDTDKINAWIYETNRELPWLKVYRNWSEGFLLFLEAAQGISERDLLDSNRYPWLKGYPLAYIILASYDHHQEHYDQLLVWLQENGDKKAVG